VGRGSTLSLNIWSTLSLNLWTTRSLVRNMSDAKSNSWSGHGERRVVICSKFISNSESRDSVFVMLK
jgi:hypothetical protein